MSGFSCGFAVKEKLWQTRELATTFAFRTKKVHFLRDILCPSRFWREFL